MRAVFFEAPHEAVDVDVVEGDFLPAHPLAELVLSIVGHGAFLVAQGVADFGACTGCDDVAEPIFLRLLLPRGNDFDLVAAREFVGEWHEFVVDFGADAAGPDLGVHTKGEVEGRGAFGQVEEVAIGREDVDLLAVEVELELVDEVDGIRLAAVEHLADLHQPVVEVLGSRFALILSALLVAPVRGQAFFGDFVHAARADLDLDPLARRGHDRGVQALVAVGLGQADPIAQAVGVGLVVVRDDAVGAPCIGLFVLGVRFQNDADGEHVVHLFKADALLLHFGPYAVNTLGPSQDFVCDPLLIQRAPNREGKGVDEARAHSFSLAQFGLD